MSEKIAKKKIEKSSTRPFWARVNFVFRTRTLIIQSLLFIVNNNKYKCHIGQNNENQQTKGYNDVVLRIRVKLFIRRTVVGRDGLQFLIDS